MKRIGGLVGVAIIALSGAAHADEYFAAGPEMRTAGTTLLTLVTPAWLGGAILFAEPRGEKKLGAGLIAGSAAMLAVGLPLFLLGGKTASDPPIAGVVGVGRVELRVAF